MDDNATEASGAGLSTRSVELVFALAILLAGAVVIYDSVRIGAQWASDGPQAGYFPWLTGCSLALAGGWLSAKTLWSWRKTASDQFVSYARLKPVLAMLAPTVVYVVLIHLIGIYAASAIYIGAFMVWQGHYRILSAALVAIVMPVLLFLLFEIWFKVPLPKGPIERMLGY